MYTYFKVFPLMYKTTVIANRMSRLSSKFPFKFEYFVTIFPRTAEVNLKYGYSSISKYRCQIFNKSTFTFRSNF